jgi:hypothetical protein
VTGRRAALVLLGLSACGPVSVDLAEVQCLDAARAARGPTGTLSVGASSNGPHVGLDLTISTDYLAGRDPAAVFDACVRRKAGQPPRTPLAAQPGWRP